MSNSSEFQGKYPQRNFATTHWSIVLAASSESSATSKSALEKLCDSYWYPLYSFVRRNGFEANQAADLTQGFFANLIERNDFESVRKEKGKFRSFLLASMRNFISNEIERANAIKRGGRCVTFSIDANSAESRFSNEPNYIEPSHNNTAETSFQKNWALALLENVHAKLLAEFKKNGRENLFRKLQIYLTGAIPEKAPTYRQLADEFETSESAIKVNVHRMRSQFREILRDEIANTVSHPNEIDEEINALFETLRR